MERESEIEIGEILSRIPKIERGRVAEVYSRSITEDRLNVPMPEEFHGEWVLNNELEISRKKGLGFIIDDVFATKVAMHNDGTGKPIIGDVIHMITTKENKKLIDKIAAEKYFEMHGTRAQKEAKQKEEKDFVNNNKDEILPITSVKGRALSRQESVSGRDIINALPQT